MSVKRIVAFTASKNIVKPVIASQGIRTCCAVYRLLRQQLLSAQCRTVGKGKTIHAPILTARIIPVRQGYLVAFHANTNRQIIVAGFLQTQISQGNASAKGKCIHALGIISIDHILAVAQVELEHIIPCATI